MYNCVVWVGEPSYGWAKPNYLANWNTELKVKVDGKDCIAPNCEFTDNSKNMLKVNVRAAIGGKCRRNDVLISLEIQPRADDMENYKCIEANDGQDCKLDPSSVSSRSWAESEWSPPMCDWLGKSDTKSGDCVKHAEWIGRGNLEHKKFGTEGKTKIGAFVSYVIAF
jgi:hypothetical protein